MKPIVWQFYWFVGLGGLIGVLAVFAYPELLALPTLSFCRAIDVQQAFTAAKFRFDYTRIVELHSFVWWFDVIDKSS